MTVSLRMGAALKGLLARRCQADLGPRATVSAGTGARLPLLFGRSHLRMSTNHWGSGQVMKSLHLAFASRVQVPEVLSYLISYQSKAEPQHNFFFF